MQTRKGGEKKTKQKKDNPSTHPQHLLPWQGKNPVVLLRPGSQVMHDASTGCRGFFTGSIIGVGRGRCISICSDIMIFFAAG